MWFILKSSFLFVWIFMKTEVASEPGILDKLNTTLESNGVTSQRIDQTKSKVIVNEKENEIFLYEPAGDANRNYYFNTLTKFYIHTNCEIAEWIRDRLFNQIELLPLLYHMDFLTMHNHVFLSHLDVSPMVINDVLTYTIQSINLLLSIVNIHLTKYDLTNNTDILRALLSFAFEINSISLQHVQDDNSSRDKYSDKIILSFVLGLLHSIQRFIFLNCSVLFYHDNRQFYGLTMNETDSQNEHIKQFFNVIEPLNLVTHESCIVREMMLKNMISWKFSQIKWRIKNDWVTVERVIENLESFTDLNMVYWYQQFMFDTIMKLLFTKLLNHYNKEKMISENTLNDIKEIISSSTLLDMNNLPSGLMKCISVLNENKEIEYSETNLVEITIANYVQSMPHIDLDENPSLSSPENSCFWNVDTRLKNLSISTLAEFISYLQLIQDALKCFIRLFQFLSNETHTYSIPISEKIEKLKLWEQMLVKKSEIELKADKLIRKKSDENEMSLVADGCPYFIGLYHFCFETTFFLNMANRKNCEPQTKSIYMSRVKDKMKQVKEFLHQLFTGYYYLQQFIVVYRVLPLLELLDDPNFSEDYMSTKRLIHVLMVEFNIYGVKYCSPPTYNFSLFNNMNFELTGVLSTEVSKLITESINKIKGYKLSPKKCKYSSVRNLFTAFNDTYHKFEQYNGVIYLNWIGQKMSIGEIQNTMENALVNPSGLYSMYGIYLKFSLAVVFWEFCKAYNNQNLIEEKLNTNYELWLKSWPKKFSNTFQEVINNIDTFIKYYVEGVPKTQVKNIKNQLIVQLEKLGVSLDQSRLTSYITNTIIQLNINNIFSFADEVKQNVSDNCVYGGIED